METIKEGSIEDLKNQLSYQARQELDNGSLEKFTLELEEIRRAGRDGFHNFSYEQLEWIVEKMTIESSMGEFKLEGDYSTMRKLAETMIYDNYKALKPNPMDREIIQETLREKGWRTKDEWLEQFVDGLSEKFAEEGYDLREEDQQEQLVRDVFSGDFPLSELTESRMEKLEEQMTEKNLNRLHSFLQLDQEKKVEVAEKLNNGYKLIFTGNRGWDWIVKPENEEEEEEE